MGWFSDLINDFNDTFIRPIYDVVHDNVISPVGDVITGLGNQLEKTQLDNILATATGQHWYNLLEGTVNKNPMQVLTGGLPYAGDAISQALIPTGGDSLFGNSDAFDIDFGDWLTTSNNRLSEAGTDTGKLADLFGSTTPSTPYSGDGGVFNKDWASGYKQVFDAPFPVTMEGVAHANLGIPDAGLTIPGGGGNSLGEVTSSSFDTNVGLTPEVTDVYGDNPSGSIFGQSTPNIEGIANPPVAEPYPTGATSTTGGTQSMGILENIYDYAKKNPMDILSGASDIWGGIRSDQRADENVRKLEEMFNRSSASADPMAPYRQAAGNEYLRRLGDPSIGVTERLNQAGPAMNRMAAADAAAGRRSRIPITRSTLAASILPGSDLSLFDPSRFGTGRDVGAAYAGPLQSAWNQQGGGLPMALGAIGNRYGNYQTMKTLRDIFNRKA